MLSPAGGAVAGDGRVRLKIMALDAAARHAGAGVSRRAGRFADGSFAARRRPAKHSGAAAECPGADFRRRGDGRGITYLPADGLSGERGRCWRAARNVKPVRHRGGAALSKCSSAPARRVDILLVSGGQVRRLCGKTSSSAGGAAPVASDFAAGSCRGLAAAGIIAGHRLGPLGFAPRTTSRGGLPYYAYLYVPAGHLVNGYLCGDGGGVYRAGLADEKWPALCCRGDGAGGGGVHLHRAGHRRGVGQNRWGTRGCGTRA